MLVHAREASLEQLSPERRISTAAALRKGQIKISEPVPLDHSAPTPVWDTPSTSRRQSQFPSVYGSQHDLPRPTDSVTGFQAPPMIIGINHSDFQTGGPLPEPNMPPATPDVYNAPPPASATPDGSKVRRKTSSLFVKDPRDGARVTPDSNHSHALSQSQVNPSTPSKDSAMDGPVKKKRRSGSFRGAFKRMFSKREKQEKSSPAREPPPSRGRGRGHEYHSSEPVLFPTPRGGLDKVTEEGRISPLKQAPKQDGSENGARSRSPMDTPRLPFPMNIHGDQPAPYNPSKSRTNLEIPAQPHRRRATLPSLVLSPSEAATLNQYWNRGSIITPEPQGDGNDRGHTPTPLIGLAITSNIASKRRSRSADALRDMASQHESSSDMRRRSAEIQFWRNPEQRIQEIDEDRALSPRSQRASIVEVDPAKATHSTPHTPVMAAEIPTTLEENTTRRDNAASRSRSISRHDFADMEEDQTQEEDEPMTRVDQRLSQLELNMSSLARSMQALSSRETSQSFQLQKPPRSRGRSRENHENRDRHLGPPFNSRDNPQVGRSASMKYPPSPRAQHPRPSPSLHDIDIRVNHSDDAERVPTAVPYDGSPLPNGQFKPRRHTTRDATTPPAQVQNFSTPLGTQKDSPTRIVDQLAPLYSALQYERNVRKTLESTILQLQRDMLNITNIIAEMRGLGAYPTPSPDHVLGMMRHHKVNHADVPPDLVHGDDEDDLLDDHGEYLGSPTAWASPRENRDLSNDEWAAEMF